MKKWTYSKTLILVTCIIFVACLAWGLTASLSSVYDTSVYVTAISVTGAISGTVFVNYLKKAASENAYKMKMMLYQDTTKQRLYFNEEMMKLKQKYNMSDEDVDNIDNQGDIDEMMSDALASTVNSTDNAIGESETVQELQTFGL